PSCSTTLRRVRRNVVKVLFGQVLKTPSDFFPFGLIFSSFLRLTKQDSRSLDGLKLFVHFSISLFREAGVSIVRVRLRKVQFDQLPSRKTALSRLPRPHSIVSPA